MSEYFTTIGLHDGFFEMEILVHSSAETKEQSEKIGNSDEFHIGYLYEDNFVIKGNKLTIKKEETDKYQFRVCKVWKPIVSHEDYENLTWDEAIKYLIEQEKRTLPFTLESYFFATFEKNPFGKDDKKIDLSKDTDKFDPFDKDNVAKMLKNKEIKIVIHDFYKKEHNYFVSVGIDELLSNESTADEGYRFIMYQLQQELSNKHGGRGLSESENKLFCLLLNDSSKKNKYVYSDQLVSEFKNVLKRVDFIGTDKLV